MACTTFLHFIQTLCRHLNVSQSTMANHIVCGNFPADWVLIFSMETGTSLEWLTYGRGNSNITNEDVPSTKIELKNHKWELFII
ncbi:helix-turn-helix domain-containing protein [Pantoea agglomerans]|uniref:helix-turn-helix domain-containing protein n=1 Tax=Enterobacter agglomerans TaxID=549 RepID=UPI0027B931D8|nr:helix-turn-helix domain-containing protein [Pantoea agglomerans]